MVCFDNREVVDHGNLLSSWLKDKQPQADVLRTCHQLILTKKMSRRRSLSHHQLDKLGNRIREKRDDMNVHQNAEKYVRFSAFDNISLSSESLKEPPAPTDIALEWDRILTSFELDYANRSNFGTDHGLHRT